MKKRFKQWVYNTFKEYIDPIVHGQTPITIHEKHFDWQHLEVMSEFDTTLSYISLDTDTSKRHKQQLLESHKNDMREKLLAGCIKYTEWSEKNLSERTRLKVEIYVARKI